MKPVLLVIDIQNEFLTFMSEQDKQKGLWIINEAIGLFRKYKLPVIRVYHTNPEEGPKPGTAAFEFPASIQIQPDDPQIIKNYPNSFKKTELTAVLQAKGCETLFLCGLSAVGCVLATYFGAVDLDFNVFMIKDAIMSHNTTYTNLIEQIYDTVSLKALMVMLESSQR